MRDLERDALKDGIQIMQLLIIFFDKEKITEMAEG
jgi:hypothetical protein